MKKILFGLTGIIVLAIALSFVGTSKAVAKNETTVVLTKQNTVILADEVSDTSVALVYQQAATLAQNLPEGECLYLVLNTPGGSIDAGLELIDNIKGLGVCVDTITVFAASMGFQIAQNLGERLMVQRGELMSHKARGAFGPLEFGGAEPSQTTSRISHWTDRVNELDKNTVARTKGKQTLESYQKAYDNELWLSAKKAVAGGYADRVVDVTCDSSLAGVRYQDVNFMGLTFTLTLSNCPIVAGILDVAVNIKTRNGSVINLNDFQKLGGQFGNACLSSNITQLCPEDITLTPEKIEALKKQAISKVKFNRDNVIRY